MSKLIVKILPPDAYYDVDYLLDCGVFEDITVPDSKRSYGYRHETARAAMDFLEETDCCGEVDEDVRYSFSTHFYGIGVNPTDAQLQKALDLVKDDYNEGVAYVISLAKGKPYKAYIIHGACQGDWAELYAPADMDEGFIRYFEAVWFGTGTQYSVESEDGDYSYSDISVSYDHEDIRNEVAQREGVDPSDVRLLVFDHYEKIAKYREE